MTTATGDTDTGPARWIEAGRSVAAHVAASERTELRAATAEPAPSEPLPLSDGVATQPQAAEEDQVSAGHPGPGSAPVRRVGGTTSTPTLWVVGAHGGAGASTVAALDDRWVNTERQWPAGDHEVAARAVLVARTHASGLLAARAALAAHEAAELDNTVRLLGLVLVADAPGRLPKPLRELVAHVSGAATHVWQIGWIPDLRFGPVDPTQPPPKALQRLTDELTAATDQPDLFG